MTVLTPHDRLEEHYAAIESRYSVSDDPAYGTLVTANGNDRVPIHRWFRMKEAYSNQLLGHVVQATELRDAQELRLFDPFSGSGTTAVSAGDLVRARALSSASVTAVEVQSLPPHALLGEGGGTHVRAYRRHKRCRQSGAARDGGEDGLPRFRSFQPLATRTISLRRTWHDFSP